MNGVTEDTRPSTVSPDSAPAIPDAPTSALLEEAEANLPGDK